MEDKAEGTGRRVTRVFALFLVLGFLIASGIGLALVHVSVDRSLRALNESVIADKAAALREAADRDNSRRLEVTRRLAASPMVRYRISAELRRSPEMRRAIIFDAAAEPIFIGAEIRDWATDSARAVARRALWAADRDFAWAEVADDGATLYFAATVLWPDGARGAVVRQESSGFAGTIGGGEARIVAAADVRARAEATMESHVLDLPLEAPGLALRFSHPADALLRQWRWVPAIVSAAVAFGLVLAFSLIFAIGRRLILLPQVELARSRLELKRSEEEARRLAIVAERATDHIIITDPEGVATWANRATLRGTGWRLDEIVGRRPREFLFGPATPPDVREKIVRARETGTGVELRSINHKKNGDIYIADIALTPVRDESGAITCYIVVERDVTETAAADARLKSAVDVMQDAFAIVDRDGRYRVFNQAYQDWAAKFGLRISVGDRLSDAVRTIVASGRVDLDGLSPEDWHAAHMQRMATEPDRAYYLRETDGETTLRRHKRLPSGETVILAANVSELIRARERAEAAVEAKSRFAASISHELRTPLIGVISMAELLLESEASESQRSGLELIAASGAALLAIINDILDFSKLEEGRLSLRAEAFDPVETIEDVCALLTAAAGAKKIDLVFRFDPAGPRRVIGDAGRVRQIATNLIGNAVKFTARGSVTAWLRAAAADGATHLVLDVEDTGPGIAEADLERIFAPYEQADGPRVDGRHEGTGLGLAICRQLADLMEGRLSARSELGRGSRFRFEARLPLAEAQAPRFAGLPVRVAGAAPWREALCDQLRGLGCDPEAAGPPALRFLAVDGRGDSGGDPLGAEDDDRPAILVAPADAMPEEAPYGDLIAGLGEGRARILRRPVRAALLARTVEALLDAPSRRKPAEAAAPAEAPIVTLVEDNETTAMIVAAFLRAAPIRLRRFAEAGPMLAAEAEAPAALILLDMNLPDMSGPDAARRIRAMEAETGAPRRTILGFTASSDPADVAACFAAGMDDVLTKPIPREALVAAVTARLAGRIEPMREAG